MEINKVILETINKLRTHPKPNFVKNPMDAIPRDSLESFVNRLKLDKALIYICTSHGKKDLIKTIHRHGSLTTPYSEKDKMGESIPEKYIFNSPIYCSNKFKKKPEHILVAAIEFIKTSPFSNEEIDALKQISTFIGDYIYEAFESTRSRKCEIAEQKIDIFISKVVPTGAEDSDYISDEIPVSQQNNYYTFEELQPGTVIATIQKMVHSAVRPYASYFVILDDGKIAIDYVQNSKARYPSFTISPPFFILDSKLLQSCFEKNTFCLFDIETLEISKILQKYGESKGTEEWVYIISVIKDGKLPIAAWIYQFDKNSLFFQTTYEKLINHATLKSIKYAIYLYQRRTKKLIVNPCFHYRDTRPDSKKVFVLMPFKLGWSDRVWTRMIKPIVEEMGLHAIRADDLYDKDIMEGIWKSILTSKVIIADISERNPNVFYELGIAHTIGKQVILLTQSEKDIPFDLNRYRHIIYEDNLDGFEKLKKELAASLKEILQE